MPRPRDANPSDPGFRLKPLRPRARPKTGLDRRGSDSESRIAGGPSPPRAGPATAETDGRTATVLERRWLAQRCVTGSRAFAPGGMAAGAPGSELPRYRVNGSPGRRVGALAALGPGREFYCRPSAPPSYQWRPEAMAHDSSPSFNKDKDSLWMAVMATTVTPSQARSC